MKSDWIIGLLAVASVWLLSRSGPSKRVNVGRVESSTTTGATAADVLRYADQKIRATDDDLTLKVRSIAEDSGAVINGCDPNSGNCTTSNGWNLPRWYLEGILGLKYSP